MSLLLEILEQHIYFHHLGGTLSGACFSFNGWAMVKRGPVLVSLFSPIGTVCSVVLLVITLGEFISVGRHSWYHRLCNGRA
ncbi:WAT1-related protein At5g47470-like [Rosa chinensis]|uniref:WAT1-related protein At5g47470-like n=1 Tax=Rosa chinensis TaxID=74649 RepID=UPI001AD8DC22|nr:WAT1-related protein At5g47470-like [Rosa chinensis]